MATDVTRSLVPANQPVTYPPILVPEISRRTFLKLLGIVVAEAAFEFYPFGGLVTYLRQNHIGGSDPEIPVTIGLLLRQAIDELREHGFPFDLEQASVVSVHERPNLIGVLLQDTRLPPRRVGANIALAIDAQSPLRSTLSYIIGKSTDLGLEISSTVLQLGGARRQRRDHFPRAGASVQQGPVVCSTRHSVHCDAPTADLSVSTQAASVWTERTSWYYAHCGDARWLADSDSILQLRYTSCQEYRNCRDCLTAPAGRARGWYGETRKVPLEGV